MVNCVTFSCRLWLYFASAFSALMVLISTHFYWTIGPMSEAQRLGYIIFIFTCKCLTIISLFCLNALSTDVLTVSNRKLFCKILLMACLVGYVISTILFSTPLNQREMKTVLAKRFADEPEFLTGVQDEFGCCGIKSFKDYLPPFPQSCCIVPKEDCGKDSKNVYTEGCLLINDYYIEALTMDEDTSKFIFQLSLLPACMFAIVFGNIFIFFCYTLLQFKPEDEEIVLVIYY